MNNILQNVNMGKDPACLFYINDWLTSTAEMDADCRGWYLNLLLHNYDKGDLPNDLEKLAVLCNVKFSEYKRFEQVFEQVIKQKFEEIESGRISNLRTQTILKSREIFKEKRSNAGKTSYLIKFFYKQYKKQAEDNELVDFVKSKIDTTIDTKNEQVIKQMFEQVFELYRNENENENRIKIDYENFILFWNKKVEKSLIPKIDKLTDKRKKSLRILFNEFSKEKFGEVLNKALGSDFLTGRTKEVYVISFDWFVNKNNFLKVMEGNYDNKKSTNSKPISQSNKPEKTKELTEEERQAIRKQNELRYASN